MRYVVNFAHRKYLKTQERLLMDPSFELPEGVYRQLLVVTEADSPEEAVRRAEAELGWPDAEIDLVPLAVQSQRSIVQQLREQEPLAVSPT